MKLFLRNFREISLFFSQIISPRIAVDLQREVAQVEGATELRLAHAPRARLVVVTCPLVDAHALAVHLTFNRR